ncbi:hypothetical protein [Mycobacterium sp.]|uniref:hypothetical protein n=1 Tax=Mycobacterium sp. TaxID=1785 RepID=UPI0031DA6E7C
MPMLTPQQISQKWLTNFQNAGTAMTQGVQAVNQAPGQKAAAQSALWLQRLQQSQQKWANRVAAVTLPEWQQAMVNLGIPRAIQGAQEKQSRYTTFINEYSQFLAGQVTQIHAMPKGTLAQGIARASAMITASYNWGQSRA